MARKKCQINTKTAGMFGNEISLIIPNHPVMQIGVNIDYDPLSRFDNKLKKGYLFRSPQVDPRELDAIWSTIQHFSHPHLIWVEFEEKNDKIELTAFARIEDPSDATMFAFAHSSFEKWSDDKEKADKLDRKRKPNKLRVTKDGRIRGKVTVETLGD